MTTFQGHQLSMFGEPPEAAVELQEPRRPEPLRVAHAGNVAAARQLRALQRSLPVVAQADPDPPGLEGWRAELGRTRPRTDRAGVCSELARRTQPDGTVAPCGWTACHHHLAIDVGEVTEVGPIREAELVLSTAGLASEMGRRPSLSAIPETAGEVDQFALDTIARLDELPETCALDVVAKYPDGAPVEVIARVLGVSTEQVRLDTIRAVAKVHRAAGVDIAAAAGRISPTDPIPGVDPIEALDRAVRPSQVKAPPPRTRPSKLATPPPAPAAIVRVEREAPAPREPTADELFTF